MDRSHALSRRLGFTLIELLVCVAIVALLLSITMNALAKARSAARTVVCQASLRGLAQATNLYYNERNDLPTTQQHVINLPGNETAIVDMLAPYHDAPPPSTATCVRPWSCPNDPWRWQVTGGTYLYFPAAIYTTWGLQPPHHNLRSLLSRNPRMLLFLDGLSIHGDSFNTVSFDGSVNTAKGPIPFSI